MIGRVNTGGGGTGAALTVTSPAGCTVTVSKDGKTKTKTAGADGVAVFKGLSSGEWTVTIANDTQTSTKTVTITADYAVSIAFFAATINVTYPAGSTCTATDGTTTLTAPDTSGSWAFVVSNTGTWTVTCTNGSSTATASVSITTDGDSKSVTLAYIIEIFDTKSGHNSGLTGGWSVYAIPYSSGENSDTSAKIAFNGKTNFTVTGATTGGYGSAVMTKKKITVSRNCILKLYVSSAVQSDQWWEHQLNLFLASSKPAYFNNNASVKGRVAITASSAGKVLSLSVPTGSWYIGFWSGRGGNEIDKTNSLRSNHLWIE